MILADTNIWVYHVRSPDLRLGDLFAQEQVLMHAFVLAEVLLGSMANRRRVREQLTLLLPAPIADPAAVVELIDREGLHGTGIGYVDSHLLASCMAYPTLKLWTGDKRLHAQAARLGVAADLKPA